METLEKNGTQTATEKVTTALAKAGITEQTLEKMKSYMELKQIAHIDESTGNLIEDKALTKKIHDARIEVKNTRIAIEKTSKSERDEANLYIKENIKREKHFLSFISPVEDYLSEQESIPAQLKNEIEERKEKEMQEKYSARAKELYVNGMKPDSLGDPFLILNEIKVSGVDLKFMSDEKYSELLSSVKIESEKIKAEEKRIADEQAAEKEKIRLQQIENEKLQVELKKQQEEIKVQQDKIAADNKKIEDEKKRIADAELKRVEDEKRAAELEVAKKEAAAKAIKDAEEKAKKDEFAKIEAEKLAKEKEERRIARMPDKRKLQEYVSTIPVNIALQLKSIEAKKIHSLADELLNEVVQKLNSEIEKL